MTDWADLWNKSLKPNFAVTNLKFGVPGAWELAISPNHDLEQRARVDRVIRKGNRVEVLVGIPGEEAPAPRDGWQNVALLTVRAETTTLLVSLDVSD